MIFTGVMIVWYINGTLQSLRVDKAIGWIARRIERAAKAQEHESRHDVVVPDIDVERPSDAADLVAPDDGYIVRVDTDRLHRLMSEPEACVLIDGGSGRAVIRGETIGWVSTPSPVSDDELFDCTTISSSRDPDHDIGYTVEVLVDIGLMALSPAVNDPRTGVECTEVLTEVLLRHPAAGSGSGRGNTPMIRSPSWCRQTAWATASTLPGDRSCSTATVTGR